MQYNENNYKCYDYQEGFVKGCEDCYDLFQRDNFDFLKIPKYVPNTEGLETEAKYYRLGYFYGYRYAQRNLREYGYILNNPKDASINELIDEQINRDKQLKLLR